MRGAEVGEVATATETAVARGLGEGATDLGAAEGGTGTTPGTGGGGMTPGTGEGEIAATPGTTGGAATAQTDPMIKVIIGGSVNHDLRCKSCNHARQYCKIYPTNHFSLLLTFILSVLVKCSYDCLS